MLYPVQLRAMRQLTGSYGWPPGMNPTTTVAVGQEFTTDNETATSLERTGLVERADRATARTIQPSDDVAAMIRSLKSKMARPPEIAAMNTAPENKMVQSQEDKGGQVKRPRGRPKGSRNKTRSEDV